MLADNQTENAIAKEFQAFVVDAFGILPVRTMGQGALEPVDLSEVMAEDGFEFLPFLGG